jgi:hypothetical protein
MHFAPEVVLSFGRGEVCAPSTAMSFFSDAPAEMRIEIERDGAATMAAHFSGEQRGPLR